jgi:hypothetical protein
VLWALQKAAEMRNTIKKDFFIHVLHETLTSPHPVADEHPEFGTPGLAAKLEELCEYIWIQP